jgi:hypothetical protein
MGAVRLGGLVTALVVPGVGGGSLATVVEAIEVTVVWLTAVEVAGLVVATRLWPPPPQPVRAVAATARQPPLAISQTPALLNR